MHIGFDTGWTQFGYRPVEKQDKGLNTGWTPRAAGHSTELKTENQDMHKVEKHNHGDLVLDSVLIPAAATHNTREQ